MTSLNEIRQYELEPGVCVARHDRAPSRIAVLAGSVWLTRDGDNADYWLQAGDSLTLAPRQRIWLSAENGAARFAITRALGATLSVGAEIRQTSGLPSPQRGAFAGLLPQPH